MFHGPVRLAMLAAAIAFGAIGLALALAGLGLPLLLAAILAAAVAGFAQWLLRRPADPSVPGGLAVADVRLEEYRAATAALRHDIRGVLSPALMMSDRLITHADPAVQRAGQAVVRSVERATSLLSTHREALAADAAEVPATPR